MKKVLLSLSVVVALAMTSCGTSEEKGAEKTEKVSAMDIKVEDIKDACGCADAFVAIGSEILEVMGDKSAEDMMSDENLEKELEPLFAKLDEAEDVCRGELDVTMEEMEECNAEVKEVTKGFESKF